MKFLVKTPLSYLLLLSFISTSVGSTTIEPENTDSYYNHLYEINKEWRHYDQSCPEGQQAFSSDIDRIQLHLQLVCKYLADNTPASLNRDQMANRLKLIETLRGYAQERIFPTNLYHSERTPYFVDDFNVHCAVGYLMQQSGSPDLVANINRDFNYDYIADIETPGVAEWAEKHGFTLSELAWIQPSYSPAPVLDSISHGTNGPIQDLIYDFYGDQILFVGDFNTVDQMPCLNLGMYKDGQLSCYGGGIDGTVNQILSTFNGVFVFGDLIDNGTNYPAAKYANGSWTFIDIPGRTGATGIIGFYGGGGYDLELVLSHPSVPGKQEIWYQLTNGTWELKADVNGLVNDIASDQIGRVYVGQFDTLTYYTASVTTEMPAHNIAVKDNASFLWTTLGNEESISVNTVKSIGNVLYFGCECDFGPNNVCLTRYMNGTFQALIHRSDFYGTGTQSVNDMELRPDNSSKLIIGGNFELNSFLYYGKNLSEYDLTYDYNNILAILDQPVTSVAYDTDGTLFLGGFFNNNSSWFNLNHIAKMEPVSTDIEESTNAKLNVYPNPFVDQVSIDGAENGTNYSITNALGQLVKTGTVQNQKITELDDLPGGAYILTIGEASSKLSARIIK